MGQAGWAVVVISMVPEFMDNTGQSIVAAVGGWTSWAVPIPLGTCLLALALFPTDARAIRVVCTLGARSHSHYTPSFTGYRVHAR